MEWENIIPGAFGLIGVLVGGFLTVAKESWFEKKKKQKEAEYLSIRIASMLDRFVSGCVDVVYDDGLSQGRPDKNGYRSIQVAPPEFKPESIDVEWKSLPANLMYEILNFPDDIEECKVKINSAFEYSADPQGYEEGFEERQFQYAELGLKAMDLSIKLREFIGVPAKNYKGWNPKEIFIDKQSNIKKLRKRQDEAQSRMLDGLYGNSA